MALSGIQIFKMTPKKNCKECGCPTCMAFSMKVAQGAMDISACPYMSDDAMAQLSEATAPPMKTIKVGTGDSEYTLGGETVLYRHEKTFVSKTRYAVSLCSCMSDEEIDAKLEEDKKVDYDRIGERMCAEMLYVNYAGNGVDKYVSLVTKAAATGKVLVLGCEDADAAKAALEVCKAGKPILNGANASNYEEMSKLATEAGVVLGVSGANIDELHDTVEAIEKLGNKNLVLDTTEATIKETFATTVQVRRASLKDTDRTFGYPSIVNLAKIAQGDRYMQQALLSLFTMKYGSIIVMERMTYAEALAGGIPLLCRRDGCLEQVVTDGENGWQYDEKEDYLMRIQEWKGMGENARGRMQNKAAISAEKFSSGNFAERVEKIYEQQIRKYRYENAA